MAHFVVAPDTKGWKVVYLFSGSQRGFYRATQGPARTRFAWA